MSRCVDRRLANARAPWLCWILSASLAGCGRLGYEVGVVPRDAPPPADLSDGMLSDAGPLDAPACRTLEVCDVVLPQCGCPAGEGCFLSLDGSLSCEPASGRLAPVEAPCTGPQSCQPGSACVRRGGTDLCAQICRDDSDCAAGVCARELDGTVDTPYRTCSSECDPLGLDRTCPTGLRCMLTVIDGRTVADCNGPIGAGLDGAACVDSGECAEGHACISGFCRALCDLAAPGCPAGRVCTPRTFLVTDFGSFGLCE